MRAQLSETGLRDARLEAKVRKAFADAWARGTSSTQTLDGVIGMVCSDCPEMSRDEAARFIEAVRGHKG